MIEILRQTDAADFCLQLDRIDSDSNARGPLRERVLADPSALVMAQRAAHHRTT